MLVGLIIGMLLRWLLIAAARLFAVCMARVLLPVTDYAVAYAKTLARPRLRLFAFYVAKGTNETSQAISGAVRCLRVGRIAAEPRGSPPVHHLPQDRAEDTQEWLKDADVQCQNFHVFARDVFRQGVIDLRDPLGHQVPPLSERCL